MRQANRTGDGSRSRREEKKPEEKKRARPVVSDPRLARGKTVVAICVIFAVVMLGAGVFAASAISSSSDRAEKTSSAAETETVPETEKTAGPAEMGEGVTRQTAETDGVGPDESTAEPSDAAVETGKTEPDRDGEKGSETETAKPEPKYSVEFRFFDRDPIYAKTDGGTVRQILADNGYVLDGLHIPSINADEYVYYDAVIDVLTLRYETVTLTEEIPFGTEYVYSDSVPSGESYESTAGVPGYKETTYTIEYINGEENYRSLDSEYVSSYPVNQVITVGTKPSYVISDGTGGVIYGADGTEYHYSKILTVRATYYNLPGNTASGLPVGDGVVAVDPSVIPLGTSIYLKNDAMDLGVRLAADTGVFGNMVDVWMTEGSPWFDVFAPTGVWEMTCYILD